MAADSPKEEIKRRIDVVAYISRYVALKRSGRRWRGRCPFHQERHPSFYVDAGSGMWKCFGCGAAGDIFTFVQRINNVAFAEAAEQLATEVGVEWRPVRQPDDRARSLRQAVFRANEVALRFFQEALRSPEGTAAWEYLARRGFTEETITRFELGYAPADDQALQRHLAARGLSPELAAQAGLVHSSHRDMFVNRIIFPVKDVTGRPIAFGGRALDEDEPAKYINSPDTPVFRKGETLYALNLARNAAAQVERLIIVEGYTDVISLHQAGIENVVACLGTALTREHLALASRYADEIVLAYDADAAGLKAALRETAMFERCPSTVKIALLPGGHDPDTLVREAGPQAFTKVVSEALPAVEFRLQLVFAQYRDAERPPAEAISGAAQLLAEVPSQTRRMEFLDKVADWWGQGDAARTAMMRRALWMEVGRKLREAQQRPEVAQAAGEPEDREVIVRTVAGAAAGVSPGRVRLERSLLASALNYPDVAAEIFDRLTPQAFSGPGHRRIAEALAGQVAEGEFRPDDLPALVGEDVTAREVLAELLLSEWKEPTEEELAAALHKMVTLVSCGVEVVRWEQAAERVSEVQPPEEAAGELEKVRAEVMARLDRGEITREDPLYQEYLRLVEMLHGRKGTLYYEGRRIPSLDSGRHRAGRRPHKRRQAGG
ncbi:MAG: DNA primase [Armatimonadetes bacterium]|nr:DNA primase [Armatimonadota bacterium]